MLRKARKRVCEQKGQTAQARKYYGRSLEIWKDEAPEQPSLGDAKKSLALLEGS